MSRSSSRHMKQLRTEFFESGRTLDADPITRHLAGCWLCGQRISYDVPPGTTPDSHNLDHYVPVADDPTLQEDPANFRHAHSQCNASRGRRAPSPGLGDEIPSWW